MEKLYSGSVVVSQYDNGISYELQLYVVRVNDRLTLAKVSNGTALPLSQLQSFARKLYTGVFTNDCMWVTDEAGNTMNVRFTDDWSKI
jgi:hypothetical protein